MTTDPKIKFKRKRGVPEHYERPMLFPSCHFEGHLLGKNVEIRNDDRVTEELQMRGCFGKYAGKHSRIVTRKQFQERLNLRRHDDQSYDANEIPYNEGSASNYRLLLIVPDKEEEAEKGPSASEENLEREDSEECTWAPDPYPVELQYFLFLEEAFFLSFGLGCMAPIDENGRKLSLKEFWEFCRSTSSTFLPRYVAYHFYRSHGWVVRDGHQYAADFVLYKDGPDFHHSSFAVRVSTENDPSVPDFVALSAVCRELVHVGKEFIDCLVVLPNPEKSVDFSNPNCIKQCEVRELKVSTWFPERAREST